MKNSIELGVGMIAGGALLFSGACASAQTALQESADVNPSVLARVGGFSRDRNVGVLERPRPQYATAGIRVGGFQLLPAIVGRAEHTDNLYATSRDEVSDTIFHIQPAVLFQSDWSSHYVAAFGNAHWRLHADNSSEDTTEWLVGVKGRLDIRRDAVAAAGASYEQQVEPRSSTGSPAGAASPVKYKLARFNTGAVKNFNRLRVTGKIAVQDFVYDNVRSVTGGEIYQKDRSNTQVVGTARAEYAISPAASMFVEVSADNRNFRKPQPGFVERDSSGYEVTVGANFEYRLLRGEARIGRIEQNYDDAAFGDVKGLSVNGRVTYYITPLTNISLNTARSVEDAAITGAGGYLMTSNTVRLDHELLRNLVLNAEAGYQTDDYRGIDRNDKEKRLAVGATYLLTRAVAVRGRFERLKVDSSGVSARPSFDDNRAVMSLYYQF
ncbi:outer membrane beta-barrel protein [Caulobacter segnis]|nr:outer membrane beta-barrel protein [Caulobacter segnis]